MDKQGLLATVGLSFVLGGMIAAPFVAFGLRSYDASWVEQAVGSAIFGLFPMVFVLAGLAGRSRPLRDVPRARMVRTVRDDA